VLKSAPKPSHSLIGKCRVSLGTRLVLEILGFMPVLERRSFARLPRTSSKLAQSRHIGTKERQAIVVNLGLSLVFPDFPSEKRFEKGSEFRCLGRQLPSPVANLIKIQGHFWLKLGHPYLAIACSHHTK